jgi:hypothetical protein
VLCFRDPAETGRKREILRLLPCGAELLADAADRDRAPGHAGQCRSRPVSTPVEGELLADLTGDDDAAMRLGDLDLGMRTFLLLSANLTSQGSQ